jgi:hypothetical protein
MEDSNVLEIALIGAYATRALANRGCSIIAISMRDIMTQREKQDLELDPKSIILNQYREYANVFSKEASNTLSPLQGKLDHYI